MGKIAEITVPTGGQATIDFTAIPATYKHLLLIVTGQTTTASTTWEEVHVQFNGDTAANYGDVFIYNPGSGAVSAGQSAGAAYGHLGWLGEGGVASAGLIEATIPRYADTTFDKVYRATTYASGAPTPAGSKITLNAGGDWNSKAAITSIHLTAGASGTATFAAGTVATLFGVDPLTAPGAGFLLAHNTNAASGVIQVGADTTETIITGLDVTLAGAATAAPIPLNWNVWISQSHSGVVKGCALRLRRTNAAGALLASLALGDPGGDSVAGHQQQWRDTLFDDSPTDGHYVMTIQNTQAAGSTFYSDTHQLWMFTASAT